ncbi:lamin tail domain-containing protein [Candidatus Uhrbacteria bacterium]|nr:lamin tail domain-containing protein [Candidatus Uhrbacteria bacterium]
MVGILNTRAAFATAASLLVFVALTTFARGVETPDVKITEVVSAPLSGEKEWVELYNASDVAVDLTGWKLTDLTDPQGTPAEQDLLALSGAIEPGTYLVFEVGATKLNNSGDSVGLYSGETEVSRVTFGPVASPYTPNARNPKEGMGASYFAEFGKWIVTNATPASANTLPAWWQ